ncbi:hypothetical protein BJY04DRAFT_218953 [Aspergillus karnatakaensis]|uniref:FAD-dependent oxidoreductase n=1 Tax=Aspergillus karnatakaensis TaxID=1810916 RepID=UPI003CCDE477
MPPSTTTKPPHPILIIGAGIAGLTTARLLTNASIPNIVFDTAFPTQPQGYAISLRKFGFSALLKALGDLPLSALTKGVAPDRLIGGTGWIDQSLRNNQTGEVIVMPPGEDRRDPSILRANREALRSWIADCGEEEVDIRYGHRLVDLSFSDSDAGSDEPGSGSASVVTATFANGTVYKGSLLIAADGVHSTVRNTLLPNIIPEIVPVLVYHGDLSLPLEDYERIMRKHTGESNTLAGVGDNFNTPLNVCNIAPSVAPATPSGASGEEDTGGRGGGNDNASGKTVHMSWSYSRPSLGSDDALYNSNIALTVEESLTSTIPAALLKEIEERDLADPWNVFINPTAMQHHQVFNWLIRCVSVDRDLMDTAVGKNVVFVGDSWHAMPIFGGEGGNHALVDGVELAGLLSKCGWKGGEVKKVLAEYYDGAFRRGQDAVRRSKQRFFQLHRPIGEWVEIAEKSRK